MKYKTIKKQKINNSQTIKTNNKTGNNTTINKRQDKPEMTNTKIKPADKQIKIMKSKTISKERMKIKGVNKLKNQMTYPPKHSNRPNNKMGRNSQHNK